MYALSFVLPAFGPSSDASGQVLYGYECFIYSHVVVALTLLEGHGDLKYSPLGLLLGCFANAYLLTLGALRWTRWRPTSRWLRIPLLLSVLSVLYWGAWDSESAQTTHQVGYDTWAIATLTLSWLCVLQLETPLTPGPGAPG
jgi:hypothetical protein